jgi:hypothetical protein
VDGSLLLGERVFIKKAGMEVIKKTLLTRAKAILNENIVPVNHSPCHPVDLMKLLKSQKTIKELKKLDKKPPSKKKATGGKERQKGSESNRATRTTGTKSTTKAKTGKTPGSSQKKGYKEEKSEERFQDLPRSEQRYILKEKLNKKARKFLQWNANDFKKKKIKKLDKIENFLGTEQSKFTAYQPTDKKIRQFIQETIDLIGEVLEEKLNELEEKYLKTKFVKKLKKKSKKIQKIVGKIDRYYSVMDAAREIVDSIKFKKCPFSMAYLTTIVKKRIENDNILIK